MAVLDTLSPNGDNGGWPTGTYSDVIAKGGAVMSTTDASDPDVLILDLDTTTVVDGDTVESVDITITARTTGAGGKDSFDVELLIGGSPVGTTYSTGNLTGTLTDYTALGTTQTWTTDYTAAQLNGAQVRITSQQAGKAATATWELDYVLVTVNGTAAASGVSGNGSLDSQDSALSAEGTSSGSGNGSLDDGSAVLTAEGISSSSGNGSLDSQDSTMSGSDTTDTGKAGNGDISVGASTASGSGVSSSSGSGNVIAVGFTMSGSGRVAMEGNGSLDAQPSTLISEGISSSVGNGNLASGGSSISGSADTGVTTPARRKLKFIYRRQRLRARKAA